MFSPFASNPFLRIERAFLRPHRPALALALGCLLLQSLLTLPLPLVQGRLLDQLGIGEPDEWRLALLQAVGISLACLLARWVFARQAASRMNQVSLEVVRELTNQLHRRVQRVPLSYLDRQENGGIMTRLTSDVGTLMIVMNVGTLQLVGDSVLAAGIAVVLFCLNWPLALVALTVIPLAAVGHAAFRGPLHRRFTDTRECQAGIVSLLAERLPALRLIRAFGQERSEVKRLGESLGVHAEACQRTLRVSAFQAAVAVIVAGLGVAAVILAGAAFIQVGRMTAGTLLSFAALAALLYSPIMRLAQFQAGLAATRVALDRMFELLDETETKAPKGSPRPTIRGSLKLDNVSFRYHSNGPAILRDVSFQLNAGRVLAIAGPSGSGKSTLLALVADLYRVDRGSVQLDGQDTSTWPRDMLRKSVALVPQRPVLFEGTIRSNLTYAAPDAPEYRLWQVLDAVCLGELVRSRQGGLDAPLGPGGEGLSGGQRQRLALARAILTEPRLLLLDDCTSALDAETETKIWRNLNQLLPGATRVIVSHKPTVQALAEEMLLLNEGRMISKK